MPEMSTICGKFAGDRLVQEGFDVVASVVGGGADTESVIATVW